MSPEKHTTQRPHQTAGSGRPAPARPPRWRRAGLDYLVLGLLTHLAVTWPVWLHPTRLVTGSRFGDACPHIWKHWWTWQALGELHTNPTWTDLLNFPEGLPIGFYMASNVEALWGLPITWAWGPVAGFNLFGLLTFSTACWVCAVFAERLGLERPIAAFVGLCWAFAPHHLGFLMGGGTENVSGPWVPLAMLSMLLLLRRPAAGGSRPEPSRWRRAGLAGVLALSVFLLAMTSWLVAALWTLDLGLFTLGVLGVHRRRRLEGVAWTLLGLGLGALMVLGAAALLLPPPLEELSSLHFRTIDPGFLFRFGVRGIPEEVVLSNSELWMNHHLLFTTGVGAVLAWGSRRGRLWLLLAIPFLLDILLPPSWIPPHGISLPGDLGATLSLLLRFPEFGFRRITPLHLLLAVACGYGLTWLMDRLRRGGWGRAARWVPVAAFAALAAESVLLGPVQLPISSFEAPPPAWAEHLAEEGPGAIIDVPLTLEGARSKEMAAKVIRSSFMVWQTVHGHPIMASVGTRLSYDNLPIDDPLLVALRPYRSPLMAQVDRMVKEYGSEEQVRRHDADARAHASDRLRLGLGPGLRTRWSPAHLHDVGFRWLVVHAPLLSLEDLQHLASELDALLGAPTVFEDGTRIYRIPAQGTAVRGRN